MGAELEKGRNLLAETSGGQIRKGPKPLATNTVNSIFMYRGMLRQNKKICSFPVAL